MDDDEDGAIFEMECVASGDPQRVTEALVPRAVELYTEAYGEHPAIVAVALLPYNSAVDNSDEYHISDQSEFLEGESDVG